MTATYKDIGVSIAGHVGQIEIQRPPHNYFDGALIGAIALGIASELVAGYLNAAYKMDVTLALMLAAIAWRMRNRSLEAA